MKKKSNNSTSKQPLVIQQLIVKAPQRKVYDVGNWRTAMRSADTGRVKALYDLFDDMLLDGVLFDAMQKRIDAVINSELTFVDAGGQEVPEVAQLIDTLAFEALLTEIMHKKFYGRMGVEIDLTDGILTVAPIPAKHINLDNRNILINDGDETGMPYDGDDRLLILGERRDFGLLLKAVQYAIYKRGGYGDWSQWVELFGMPQRIGKYNTHDPESRRLLEEALEKAGSAPYVVVPKEAEIETRSAGTNSGDSYNEFRQACNEEMLITILGQTLTTVQGDRGARSLGEVHKDVEESKNRSDLRFVQRVLNQYVLPMLEARGVPVSGGAFVFPKAAEALTVNDIVQLSAIMDIPQSYLHEKYSIPVPEEGEPVARRQSSPMFAADMDDPDGDDDDNGDVKNSDRSLFRRLRDFFAKAPATTGAMTGGHLMRLSDDATFNDRLIARVADGASSRFDPELFRYFADDFLKAVRPAFESLLNNVDVTYNHNEDAYITSLEMSLFQFSAAKTLAEVQELNRIMRDSTGFEDFRKKANEVCTAFNVNWQRAEYDTAVLFAESAANYQRLFKQVNIFPYWKYVTVGDGLVRPEHAALNGVILPYNDPAWSKIFPPNGWRCRCRVAGVMKHEASNVDFNEMRKLVDDYYKTDDWKRTEASGFDVNPGRLTEVFQRNQQYIRKFPEKAKSHLESLRYYDYGLDSFSKKVAAATVEAPKFDGDKTEWFANNKIFDDYKGRKITMPEKVFNTHTSKKYEKVRVPLLNCIRDVLANPDELWLADYKGSLKNLYFIKFYKDKVINVVCELKTDMSYEVSTWFEIEQSPRLTKGKVTRKQRRVRDPRWMYRRGLLIKSNGESNNPPLPTD